MSGHSRTFTRDSELHMSRAAFSADIETQSYMRAMRAIGRQALPRAVAEALNAAADASAAEAKRNVQRRLIVRTAFTLRSIRQDRTARGTNFVTMHSRVGSNSPYLPIQDEGGTITAEKNRIPLPTLGARTGRSIRRSIATRYRMNRMGDFGSGSKFFIGKSRRGRVGIYERMARRIRMIRSLEETRVKIPATRWFSDAIARFGTPQFIRAKFIAAARRQLRRGRSA